MNDADDKHRSEHIHDGPDKGPESPGGGKRPDRPGRRLTIRIDRKEYGVPPELLRSGHLTGQQIRRLADPDIGRDRDLFEVVPGGSDLKIDDQKEVLIRNHMRFFSAPAVINPGSVVDQVTIKARDADSTNRGRDVAE